jgi:hypothetical protein
LENVFSGGTISLPQTASFELRNQNSKQATPTANHFAVNVSGRNRRRGS